MITLTVLAGPDAGSVFTFEQDTIVIGRSSACDIMLHDGSAGRRHCEIRREGPTFIITDLGSANGTFLNDQKARVTTRTLHNRDEISLGKSRLRVEFPEVKKEEVQAPSSPPAPENPPVVESVTVVATPSGAAPRLEEATVVAAPQERPQPRILLRVIEGHDAGKVFEPKPGTQRFTVGRGQITDCILADRQVSRVHFVVECTPAGFVLIDEGSLNGTFLNDETERVSRAELKDGDEIRISETRLKVEIIIAGEARRIASLPSSPTGVQRSPAPESKERPVTTVKPREELLEPVTLPSFSRLWAVFIPMLVATAGAASFLLLGERTLFSSGPLSASHEQWEETCVTCHPPWGIKPMSVTCSAADCHAHELRANAQAQDDCRQCHTEHRGRSFNIRGDDTRCWSCHQEGFPERPVWRYYSQVFVASGESGRGSVQLALPAREEDRQAWEHSVSQEESGLIFAHTAHAKTSGQENCLACHQPLPGEIVNALGKVSAFPTHTECIECHSEVGSADPQAAQALASRQCQKCHTQADGTVTRVQKRLDYVQFSHDSHKTADCVQCHFTVTSERAYRPVLRSALYPLPMEACVSCHEQQHATTVCLDCHRAHHSLAAEVRADAGWLTRITLSNVLFTLLVLEGGVWAYMYFLRESSQHLLEQTAERQ